MSGGGGGGVQETADQVQEQKNNVNLQNYYTTTYKPFIDKFIAQKTGDAASGTQTANAKGQVNAEVMKGATKAAMQPGQTNPVALTKQMDKAAMVDASAQGTAQGKVRQQQMGSLQNIVDIGRGQQTQAQRGQQDIAEQSLQTEIQNQQMDQQTTGAVENAAGSVAGAAAAGYYRSGLNKSAITDTGSVPNYTGAGAGGDLDSGMFDSFGNRIK